MPLIRNNPDRRPRPALHRAHAVRLRAATMTAGMTPLMSPTWYLSRQLQPRVDAHPKGFFVVVARIPPSADALVVAGGPAFAEERGQGAAPRA